MRACQALALDEERTTFHPQLWNEATGNAVNGNAAATDPARARFIKDERLSQVWFSGVHTNVGGGYPDDALAYIPFVWMITEAQRCGLKFKSDYANQPPNPDLMIADPDTFKNAISRQDKDGRLYDPRKGLGGYYRYGPRKLVPHFYPGIQKAGRRRGRRRTRQNPRERVQAHREPRACLCAGRPSAVLRRRQGTRRRDRHARPIWLRDHGSAPPCAPRRRSMSGTRSGSGASSISQPSAPRSGW